MATRVSHISFSRIEKDQRILRAGQALESEGFDVSYVGNPSDTSSPQMGPIDKVRLAVEMVPSWVLPDAWSTTVYSWRSEYRDMLARLLAQRPDIIHAHDWDTLPIAATAAQRLGAKFIYDSHEAAAVQRAHRPMWRLTFPPFIRAIERSHIHNASAVITVSDGIADYLMQSYNLVSRPTVLRSTPSYQEVAARDVDPDRILVHYHGIFTHGRGLSEIVRSVRDWPPAFRLRLTGWGQPRQFQNGLEDLAAACGVKERVEFHPRVAFNTLVNHASEADIGLCFWPAVSVQQEAVLPNKFFEYTIAGLMVIVSQGRDMQTLVERHGHGAVLGASTADALAGALRGLSVDEIMSCRRNALKAARELNWESEKEKLIGVYRAV